jgi:hypothetical protein
MLQDVLEKEQKAYGVMGRMLGALRDVRHGSRGKRPGCLASAPDQARCDVLDMSHILIRGYPMTLHISRGQIRHIRNRSKGLTLVGTISTVLITGMSGAMAAIASDLAPPSLRLVDMASASLTDSKESPAAAVGTAMLGIAGMGRDDVVFKVDSNAVSYWLVPADIAGQWSVAVFDVDSGRKYAITSEQVSQQPTDAKWAGDVVTKISDTKVEK